MQRNKLSIFLIITFLGWITEKTFSGCSPQVLCSSLVFASLNFRVPETSSSVFWLARLCESGRAVGIHVGEAQVDL